MRIHSSEAEISRDSQSCACSTLNLQDSQGRKVASAAGAEEDEDKDDEERYDHSRVWDRVHGRMYTFIAENAGLQRIQGKKGKDVSYCGLLSSLGVRRFTRMGASASRGGV